MLNGMKYRFLIMTNFPNELKQEIEKFNKNNGTDLTFVRTTDDEVLFAELESSMSDELIFEFGVQFGIVQARLYAEGKV
jgi:hypothetical protein